jgi:hypothetical protein
MNRNSSNLIRLAAPLLALCFAGAALAQPRDGGGGDQAQADCNNAAALQLSIDMAQCAAYPGGSTAYNDCQAAAAMHFSIAIARCGAASAAATRGGALSIVPPGRTPGLVGTRSGGKAQHVGTRGLLIMSVAGFKRR